MTAGHYRGGIPPLPSLLADECVASGVCLSQRFRFHDLVFACALVVIFTLLVSVMEWPDAMEHISRKLTQQTTYPFDFFSSYANLQAPVLNGDHSVFADHYMYLPRSSYFWINLERLPLVLMIVAALYLLANRVGGTLLLFCPPLIYSLAAPSQEVIAISIVLFAVIVLRRYPAFALLLAFLSMQIDRSMVPSAIFITLFAVASPFRTAVTNQRVILSVGLLLVIATSFVSPLDLIGAADNKIKLGFGFTAEDIKDTAQFGQRKLFALAASTMGLFGWMSVRPFPFWLYYPSIIFLFIVGFATSNSQRKSIFIALCLLSYLVLWLFPSFAQARYYPLLTLAFWGMVISGAQAIRIAPIFLYTFVATTTAAGCIVSLLGAI